MTFNFELLGDSSSLFLNTTDRLTRCDASDSLPQVVYDVSVIGFAVSHDAKLVAVTCAVAADEPRRRDAEKQKEKMEIRLFDLNEGWLEALRCTFTTKRARFVGWTTSDKYLYLYDGDSHVSIMSLDRDPSCWQFKFVVEDRGRHPLSLPGSDLFGLFNEREQQISFWDIGANKVVSSLRLARRSIKLLHIVVVEKLLVSLYDDMSITFTSVTGTIFSKLQKFDSLFPSSSAKGSTPIRRLVVSGASNTETMEIFLGAACHEKIYHFSATLERVSLKAETTLGLPGFTLRGLFLATPSIVAVATSGRGKTCKFEHLQFSILPCAEPKSKSRRNRKKNVVGEADKVVHAEPTPFVDVAGPANSAESTNTIPSALVVTIAVIIATVSIWYLKRK